MKINTKTGKAVISDEYLKKKTIMNIVNNQQCKVKTYEDVWINWDVDDSGVVKFINN